MKEAIAEHPINSILIISALVTVIVALAAYIRWLHNRRAKDWKDSDAKVARLMEDHTKRMEEAHDTVVKITERVTEVVVKVDSSVQSLEKTIETNGVLTKDALRDNTSILHDLHKFLLSATQNLTRQ